VVTWDFFLVVRFNACVFYSATQSKVLTSPANCAAKNQHFRRMFKIPVSSLVARTWFFLHWILNVQHSLCVSVPTEFVKLPNWIHSSVRWNYLHHTKRTTSSHRLRTVKPGSSFFVCAGDLCYSEYIVSQNVCKWIIAAALTASPLYSQAHSHRRYENHQEVLMTLFLHYCCYIRPR
jgi:hypothetical protein